MHIQWYPGHMTKTKRMMQENISLVDVVIELLDARIPYSSKNPDIDTLANNKHRIIVLNKADLADKELNKQWEEYFINKGFRVIQTNSQKGQGVNEIVNIAREQMAEKIQRLKARGRIFVPIRAMIVGIPNVGKSTLINRYVKKNITKTGDRPGVTKSKQWVKIKKDFELLDTPGILWPKFEDQEVGKKLALTGAINDSILDINELAHELIKNLLDINPTAISKRYDIPLNSNDPNEIIYNIAEKRGFKAKGNEIDIDRASIIILDEFRGGLLGKITLERPNNE
ncbi:MAG: ribosome biogenesis GTPase YlqF [Lachnospirales bacterium]